jgi:hypothetical protein
MSTMGERSMMWRTTFAFGALGFGLLLACIAFQVGGDAHHSPAVRIFGALPLLLGACMSAIIAVRELRGDKVKSRAAQRW